MKNGTKTLIAVAAGATVAYVGMDQLNRIVFNKTFVTHRDVQDKEIDACIPDAIKEAFEASIDEQINWFSSAKKNEKKITSFDGMELNAIYAYNEHPSDKLMILVHDYDCDRYVLLKQALGFAKMGYDILLPDQRGYGKSEGGYCTYGAKECLDLQLWIHRMVQENPNVEIGLYGVGAGASTVMMALGFELEQNVKFAIEDSGFTSLDEWIQLENEKKFGCLSYVLQHTLTHTCVQKAGFDPENVSPLRFIRENKSVPLLFIHSTNDPKVPYEMATELFAGTDCYKKFIIEKGETSGFSCYEDAEYFRKIETFISYLKQTA